MTRTIHLTVTATGAIRRRYTRAELRRWWRGRLRPATLAYLGAMVWRDCDRDEPPMRVQCKC